MNTFVATIDLALAEKMKKDLSDQGFSFSKPPHSLFSAKKEKVSITLYSSGKLTVQGKGMDEFIRFYLEPEILQNLSYSHPELSYDMSSHSGSDEAGKGDLFGPLCVAAVFANETDIKKLLSLGVKDSKTLSNETVLTLAKKIEQEVPSKTLRLFPQKYNELYASFQNLNTLLAWAHGAVLADLIPQTGCQKAIIDQFATGRPVERALQKRGLFLTVIERTKAEEDPVVAAASILARASFLKGMEILSKEAGFTLPKGAAAATVTAAKRIAHDLGKEALPRFIKMHFKTAIL